MLAAAEASAQPRPNLHPTSSSTDTDSILSRRRQLEAELANLPPVSGYSLGDEMTLAYDAAASIYLPVSKTDGSGSDSERGKYERIDRDDVEEDKSESGSENGKAHDPPSPTKSTGWFSWGNNNKAGYTKLKEE